MLMVGTKLGNDELAYSGGSTPLAAYEQIVGKYRESVNFHTAQDEKTH
jgi:6-phosphogluconolactonase/glucosamine-6-phosphate isomerase/deaminase